MDKVKEFSFEDKGKIIKFVTEKLKAVEQSFFILRIISIISKGHVSDSAQIEQILHNMFQTGHNIENIKKSEDDVSPLKLLLDAIKGALAALSDKDRDWLVAELLKNTRIIDGMVGSVPIYIQVSIDELNNRLSGFQPVFKLLMELVKIKLGFL